MITDGTFACSLCGQWLAGCALCGKAPLVDRRAEIKRSENEQRAAEEELRRQEACIRTAAELRRGENPARPTHLGPAHTRKE